MIPWNQKHPESQSDEATITIGPCQLSVRERCGSNKRWQFAMISVGEFSEAPLDECLETWPKRAIQLAHQVVNELVHKLKELDA